MEKKSLSPEKKKVRLKGYLVAGRNRQFVLKNKYNRKTKKREELE